MFAGLSLAGIVVCVHFAFLTIPQPTYLDHKDIDRIHVGESYIVLVRPLLYRRTERDLLELMADHSFAHETRDRGFNLRRYRCTESPEVDDDFKFSVTGLDVEVMNGCPVSCCAIVFSMGEKRFVPCSGSGLLDLRTRVVQAMDGLIGGYAEDSSGREAGESEGMTRGE